eukprot:9398596-Alexandrium_andersonii.AAC.1
MPATIAGRVHNSRRSCSLRCHLQLPPRLMHHCGTRAVQWMCAGCGWFAAEAHGDAAAAVAELAAFHRRVGVP